MTGQRTTRRGVLALAGGVALAGCGRRPFGEEEPRRLDGAALRAAVEAVTEVEAAPAEPELVAEVVPDLARDVSYADDLLTEREGVVRTDALDRPVAEYVVATERAHALPGAAERVGEELRS